MLPVGDESGIKLHSLFLLTIIAFLVGIIAFYANNDEFQCGADTVQVEYVHDGDTFVGADNTTYRLAGIDATELRSQGGSEAKQKLKEAINGKELCAIRTPEGKGYYNRDLIWLFADGRLVNYQLLKSDNAELYDDN